VLIGMADASNPTNPIPPNCKIVAGYIGGRTPHIWTLHDWNKFPGMRRLPIWVYTGAGGYNDGFACLQALYSLGIPRGSRVVLDMETLNGPGNRSAVLQFWAILRYFGYKVWVYGSASTVLTLPAANGYWIADWTFVRHMFVAPNVRATQWTDKANGWDLSTVKGWVYRWPRSVWWRG
jgi:hypothetical protein